MTPFEMWWKSVGMQDGPYYDVAKAAWDTATAAEHDLAFRQGYYLAVANLLRLHDEPTMAAEVMTELGPIDYSGIDGADRAVLESLYEGRQP